MNRRKIFNVLWSFLLVLSTFSSVLGTPVTAQGPDLIFYGDALYTGWNASPWGDIDVDLANTDPVYQGDHSLAITFNDGWAGTWLVNWNEGVDLSGREALRFWIYATEEGHSVVFTFHFMDDSSIERTVVTSQAGQWIPIEESLIGYTAGLELYGIQIFNNSGSGHGVFYLDQIVAGDSTETPLPPIVGPALSVDATANQHPISTNIYGMNFADEDLADEVQLPVRRWGGNSTTRYNWETNVHNIGSDWYFENVPNDESADDFVEQNHRTGSETLMTIPLIGWTPNPDSPLGHPYDCGFKVSRYGAQDSVDPWDEDCGNGQQGNVNITGNNPLDTSIVITTSFVTGWINHLITEFGTAANGGVRFYNLDNEPMLWNSTHRDVHPVPPTAAELRDKGYLYAAAIKAADPAAQTLGPVTWGWCAYFCSAAADCCSPDAGTTGDQGRFTEWYLEQMQAYETAHGARILDYLDLHYYPAAEGVSLSGPGGTDTQALRLRSTRSLWDPTYHDESWIEDTTDEPIQMIRRMKQWVADNYPGTKTAITEYNWGAANHINGALAQADVLGIFGREGLDLATLWGPPTSDQPVAYAFRMYRNYDGNGGMFGDISVQATSTDQGQLSVYAAQRSSDGALTVMIVNKAMRPLTSTLSLANYQAGALAQVYRYDQEDVSAIVRLTDQSLSGSGFTMLFPLNSITLIVLAPAGGAVTGVAIDGPTEGWAGADQKFTALVAPPDASTPITYTWTPAPDSGQGTATVTYNWDTAGSQTITVTARNFVGGPVTGTHTITIAVPNIPVTGVEIAGPTSGVVDVGYTFTADIIPDNATTPITYTWTPAPDSGQGTATVTYSWATAGSKTIAVTAGNDGTPVADTHTITIAAANVPVSAVQIDGPASGFVDVSYVYTAVVSPPNATLPIAYTWSPAPDSGQGTATATYSWTAAGSQTITVTAQNSAGGPVTDTHTVAIAMTGMTLQGTPGDHEIHLDWQVLGTLPAETTWTINYEADGSAYFPITGLISPTRAYILTGLTNDIWYTVTLNAMVGAAPILTDTVFVMPRGPVPVDSVEIAGPVSGVTGASYVFTAGISPTNATAPFTYTWNPAPNAGQGTSAATYAWIAPGPKTIMVTVQNAGDDATDTHIINIAAANVPVDSVAIDGPGSGVTGASYAFTANISPTNATTPITYTWTPAPGSGQGTATAAYTWGTVGSRTITVTADNGWGSAVATHEMTIVATSIPVDSVQIGGPISGMVNTLYAFTVVVSPANATAPFTYTWNPAPNSGQNTTTARYSWAITGTQAITVTVENDGGYAGDTHAIEIVAAGPESRIYLPLLLRQM
ncbi:MAG: hypothetical protein JXA21_28230 [Anaerolineae bacterium]|nr:hypothetical protein [Anaerolineae bacterium]